MLFPKSLSDQSARALLDDRVYRDPYLIPQQRPKLLLQREKNYYSSSEI